MNLRPRSCLFGAALGGLAAFFSIWSFQAEEKAALVVENPRELYQIAASQIAAFRRDDYPTAYTFAATGIREKFPLEQFSAMVRQTYPQLTLSGRLNFGETRFGGNQRASALIYVSNQGGSVPMIYAFIRENGIWKVEGVQLLRGRNLGTTIGDPRT